jgi:hypothetical protein
MHSTTKIVHARSCCISWLGRTLPVYPSSCQSVSRLIAAPDHPNMIKVGVPIVYLDFFSMDQRLRLISRDWTTCVRNWS